MTSSLRRPWITAVIAGSLAVAGCSSSTPKTAGTTVPKDISPTLPASPSTTRNPLAPLVTSGQGAVLVPQGDECPSLAGSEGPGDVVAGLAPDGVLKAGQAGNWIMTLKNPTAGPVLIAFVNGNIGDVVLKDAGGKDAYRWSSDKAPTTTLRCERIAPGATATYHLAAAGPKLPVAGHYTAVLELETAPLPNDVTVPVDITP